MADAQERAAFLAVVVEQLHQLKLALALCFEYYPLGMV